MTGTKRPDLVAWHYEETGVFSVRSAYRLALARSTDLEAEGSSSVPRGDRAVWRKLWKLPIPPKVRNFLWKLINNGLPTNANRCFRHLTADGACELCRHDNEDGFHAVMDCPHAKGLRYAMRRVWSLPPEEILRNEGPEWFLVLLDSWRKEEVALLAMVLWRAWPVRNKVTRAGEALSIDDSVEFLERLMSQFLSANEPMAMGCVSQPNAHSGCSSLHWIPPARNAIKINVDRAFLPRSGQAAVGVIARDHEGNPLVMAWRLLFHCRDAKALALLEGLCFAGRWPCDTPLEFESDCSNLVAKVSSSGVDRSESAALIADIKVAIRNRRSCVVVKVGRDQNDAAHKLAHHALLSRSSKSSFSFVPECIQDLVLNDRIRCQNPGILT
jgi:hypothetical protein